MVLYRRFARRPSLVRRRLPFRVRPVVRRRTVVRRPRLIRRR